MAIRGVVSVLGDQRYIAMLERELLELHDAVKRLEEEVVELRRSM